jgi:predicted nuclease with TOPRIM domain
MKLLLKILPWALLAVALFFLIKSCGKPKWQEIPKVETVKEQQAKIDTIIQNDTKGRDSAINLFKSEQKNTEALSGLLVEIQKENRTLAEKVREQAEKECPNLTPQLDKLANEKAKQESINAKVAAGLRNQIALKSKMVADCDKTKSKLLARLDSAFKNQNTLTKTVKNIKLRAQLVLSGEAFGNQSKILQGYAAGAGIRFKNGTMILIKAYQFNGSTSYGGQLVYPISFRK